MVSAGSSTITVVSTSSQTSSASTEPATSTSTELPGINIAITVTYYISTYAIFVSACNCGFSALHEMPARTSYEKGVCLSIYPSVCLSVKCVDCDKTEKDLSRFLY